MTGSQPHSESVLSKDLWQILFTQAYLFAAKYINRLRWRGDFGGVLPDGYDAESIAAQAVLDFLKQSGSDSRPFISDLCLIPAQHFSVLSRLVWRHVDRLHHRRENFLLRNDSDLAPVYTDDGETCNVIETIPDPGGNPYDNLVRKETTENFEAMQTQLRKFLSTDNHLKTLYTCYTNGICKPRDVAPRLRLTVSATKNLQKRLKRRLRKFLDQQSHAE